MGDSSGRPPPYESGIHDPLTIRAHDQGSGIDIEIIVGPAPDLRSGGARHKLGEHIAMSKRTATKPSAKSRPKTKSRTPAASRAKMKSWDMRDMEDMEATPPWCDEAFFDQVAQWWDSPERSLWLDMSCELEEVVLKDVGLDARQRKFLWPDAGPLDLDQSARRINQQYPDYPEDTIKKFLINWIQLSYEPKGYSQSQMDELGRLIEQWAEDVNSREN
jgi:hypothetical protein